MNNFQQIEKLMMLPSRRANSEYAIVYENVVNVFRFKDRKDLTNHCDIFKLLYDVNKRTHTYNGVATAMCISDNALRRYRKEYTEWFCYFIELERSKKCAA